MKYCPECDTEYLDRAERCADCGCDLIDEQTYATAQQRSGGSHGPYVTLCPVADQVEAERLMEVLARDRVPVHLHTFGETVYIGHTDAHQGYGELWVPKEWLHHARVRLDELENAPSFGFEDE